MGLSSFWSSIRGQRAKDINSPSKHSHPIYDQHATVPSPQAHSALRPDNTALDAASAASPPATKKQKRRSLWKSPEPDFISVVQQVPAVPAAHQTTDKKAKRRSFWRAASQNDIQTTQDIPLLDRAHTAGDGDKLRKRRSFWRGQSQNDMVTALPLQTSMGPAPAPDIGRHPDNNASTAVEQKSRRLSRRQSSSSKSSKRLSKSLSIFGGGADDDSDDEIPAVPVIPNASLWEQQRDQGRYLGMVDSHPATPGTAITSDELYNTAASPLNHDASSRSKENRLSRGLSLHRTKSSASHSSRRSSSTKRKRRSWFAPGSSNPDDEDGAPPLPQLPSLEHDDALTPGSETSDFERFLHTSHEAAQRRLSQQQPTDYERFLRESHIAMGEEPPRVVHRSSKDMKQPRPKSGISNNQRRSSYAGPRNAAGAFLKTSTEVPANVRRSWRRSYGPGAYGGRVSDEERALDMVCLSTEQQQEWDKLKHLMEVMEKRQDDGVFGMLRELEEDEEEESYGRSGKPERGVYQNSDALAALEYGTAR